MPAVSAVERLWVARAPCGCVVATEAHREDYAGRLALANKIGGWMTRDYKVERAEAAVVGHTEACTLKLE